jgi:tripartite-type tricarboxylate transporter receptor subunit TctC
MRTSRVAVALALIFALASANAVAQSPDTATYPNRPVRIVVPFPAGGPTDILARVVAQRLSEVWGQGVVIENQPGANTAIAAARVAKMPPDGYTLFAVMDVTMVLNPITNKALSYDPLKDFAPITLASKNTSLLSVRAEDGPTSVRELIARAKASPGKLNYGAGIITTRLAGYLFNREAGIDVQYIPFQGSPPTVQGLLTGAVDYIVDGAATSLPLIQSGKLRALAKLNSRPLPALPDVRPLAVEAGIPALDDISTWIGLVAPAGTPRAIIDKIQREVVAMYADPAIAEKLAKAGITTATSTPEELDAFVRKELERWGQVFRDSGIQLN